MKSLRLLIALSLTAACQQALAQAPFQWQIIWGQLAPTPVPLGPWTSLMLALGLGLAAVGLLRRHRGSSMTLAAAALAAGIAGYSIDRVTAAPAHDLSITDASGNVTLNCPSVPEGAGAEAVSNLSVINQSGAPVFINSVTPIPDFKPMTITDQCTAGSTLPDGAVCYLPCGVYVT